MCVCVRVCLCVCVCDIFTVFPVYPAAADNLTVIQGISKVPSNILTMAHLSALRDLMSTEKITGSVS